METKQAITAVSEQREWLTPSRFLVFTGLTVGLVIFVWTLNPVRRLGSFATSTNAPTADTIDQRLQRAATLALGNRRGTVIVMDPQTGRVRAVVNPTVAFEEELPPGSTIKPFTALAALRSHVIEKDSRTLCGEEYAHDDFHTTCSHPRDLPPLNPTDALAYSCNFYFGKVGERLAESDFDSTLEQFGFGKTTGVNAVHEAAGAVRRSQWRFQNAIGEGDYLRATPLQIISAYSALVNGGRLLTPRVANADDFVPEVRSRVTIDNDDRQIILKGMRGAIRFGTAETAHLYSLPNYVFGKTGTATEINGYRSQGWFIGFASALDEKVTDESAQAPENVKLAVLVFLYRAHGSDSAEAALPVFEEYARSQAAEQKSPVGSDAAPPVHVSNETARRSDVRADVRVHLVRENATRVMSIEDYVRGVVAAEGSLENEPEALKALAVASRSYAMKNLGRHSADGYDFCTTTHCQRFHLPEPSSDVPARVEVAVANTNGEVLRDVNDEVADSYFSASCGGATANLATLWGGNAPPYLRGVKDNSCLNEPHHSWIDVISQNNLLKALQSDQRTNVGERLASVSVLRRDASGRAELIAIDGSRRTTIKGWDFKIIVGRALGWNLLKSSRFEISRSGSNFVFRGSGFGHGLGLCQEGAHVMAERGASYRQILEKYFPSTSLKSGNSIAADLFWSTNSRLESLAPSATDLVTRSPRSLRSENFRITYPQSTNQRDVEELLQLLERNRQSLIARVASAGIAAQFPTLEIFVNETTGNFVGRTGQPSWAAAATRNRIVDLQPLATLKRRRILETTVRHELVHSLIESLGGGRAPRWLAEGLALHLAGEGRLVSQYQTRPKMAVAEIDRLLGQTVASKSPEQMRAAYAAAYSEVKRLIDNEGEASVWRRVAQ